MNVYEKSNNCCFAFPMKNKSIDGKPFAIQGRQDYGTLRR
jgi:hypothetical protein